MRRQKLSPAEPFVVPNTPKTEAILRQIQQEAIEINRRYLQRLIDTAPYGGPAAKDEMVSEIVKIAKADLAKLPPPPNK